MIGAQTDKAVGLGPSVCRSPADVRGYLVERTAQQGHEEDDSYKALQTVIAQSDGGAWSSRHNTRRRHSSLGYLSPNAYEMSHHTTTDGTTGRQVA